MSREWVAPEYRELFSTQSYGTQPRIDGVEIVDLRMFGDEGGDFCEVARTGEGGVLSACPGFRVAQINYSLLEPGTIKAWHLHRNQADVWFVPPQDRLLAGLIDLREGSTTYQASMRLTLGASRPRLLHIPAGVAHGVANLSGRPGSILYFTDRAFDQENPDEHRLPYDLLGADFWTIQPG